MVDDHTNVVDDHTNSEEAAMPSFPPGSIVCDGDFYDIIWLQGRVTFQVQVAERLHDWSISSLLPPISSLNQCSRASSIA